MKYCAPCRLRAKDDDDNCSRCGGSLRSMGAPPGQQPAARTSSRRDAPRNSGAERTGNPQVSRTTPSGTRTASAEPKSGTSTSQKAVTSSRNGTRTESAQTVSPQAQFQIAGLEQQVQTSSRRVRLLAVLAGVLAISFSGLVWYLRHSYVMQFAEVGQLEIVRSELNTGTALIRFRPLTAGRIQFVRVAAGRQETLLEHSSGASPEGEFKEFHWAGDADGSWSISIRYRDGGSLVDRDWQSTAVQRTKPGVLAAVRM